ncbi:hypothetical protein GCM10007368_07620 [Isoptericola cucumis]|uniref:Restriction endonuclease type II-like domain-containing protein n=2 Tax=Isoptericola cucumis TaxID=1776856 RepID=A0ABQ2B528_9MICO|nr:hypothetical protein [Isoptericola cucumis]GGI05728.1 hypothetical protein GCM10007368_07620 [Isoptericola cucumis]
MRAARRTTAPTAVTPPAAEPAEPVAAPEAGRRADAGENGRGTNGGRAGAQPAGGRDARDGSGPVPGPTVPDAVEAATRRWRASLVEMVGGSSLSDVGLLGEAVVDLSAAHPSGVAGLFAGRPTRLSNLVREGEALPAARRRARAVAARSAEHASRYGVAPTYLAIGVATWVEPDEAPEVPFGGGGPQRYDVAALARVASGPAEGPQAGHEAGDAPDGDPAGDAHDPAADGQPASAAAEDEGPALTSSIPVVSMAARDSGERPVPPAGATGRVDGTPDGKVDGAAEAPARGRVVHAPVVLRPVTLTPRGDGGADYDLTLEPTVEINPVVARTLRAHGALLDPAALAKATFTLAGFDPTDVLARIASLGEAVLTDFTLDRRVLVGTFVHPGQMLVDDLDELAPSLHRHEVVAALAGVDDAADRLRSLELPEVRRTDADPTRERGVGDLDPHQRHALDALATGGHFFVDAPVGSDVAGTLAAVVAEATSAGRSVLYVTGHRRAADRLSLRLENLGLDSLLLDIPPHPTWREEVSRRLLAAMASEPEQVDTDATARVRDALIGTRAQLTGYIEALHERRSPWQVSAYDALQALARLTSERPAPSTGVRLASEAVVALDGPRRRELAADLVRAAELGAFTLRPSSTPWFGAQLVTDDDARQALLRVERLRDVTLPQLRRQIAYTVEVTGLTTPTTVRRWGEQLTMLGGMRSTLDVFHPMVFERTAADLVQATASRRWRAEHGIEMGWPTRRRLRKRAKDMVRPGVRVPDLHAALVNVQEQREVWAEHAQRGGWPTLPEGLASIEDTYEAVRIDLEALEPVLATTTLGGHLLDLDLDGLAERLQRLAGDSVALAALPERTALLRRARSAGIGDLVDDLADRRSPATLVHAELELAWWSSVFEQLLAADPALAGQDGAGLDALARRFRQLDREHLAALAQPVRVATRAHLGAVMREDRDGAEALFTELIEGRLTTLRDLAERHGDVLRRLRPTLIATPTLVPHLLPAHRTADVVILDAVQHVPTEVVVPAIARARQVVVVGDPRSASGTSVHDLAGLLPTVTLQPHDNSRDPELTRLLAAHGYEGLLRPAPLPRAEELVRLDVVDGTGMPDPVSGSVESTQAEVDRVVEASIEHALTRPEETFAVVTVTAAHADRVREALLAEVRANPALAPFFSGSRPEPVVVADITGVAGLSRDTILLSVGFGRTPHGRVLHRFGVLGEAGGEAMLLGALGATRQRLHVVSCFRADALDPERLRGAGPRLLAEMLDLAERRSGAADQVRLGNGVDVGRAPDRLLVDLGERLWKLGYLVETDYGAEDGDRIPLVVGHPDLPGQLLVAVLTDDAAYVAEPSVRVRDRQLAERLERVGWVVTQVWSAAAFLDPDGEAERVRVLVQRVRDERIGTAGGVVPPREVVVPVLPDEDDEDDAPPVEVVADDAEQAPEPDAGPDVPDAEAATDDAEASTDAEAAGEGQDAARPLGDDEPAPADGTKDAVTD